MAIGRSKLESSKSPLRRTDSCDDGATSASWEGLQTEDLTPGSGDKLLVLDTNTGLEWLKPTATVGQSVNSVLGGFGGFLAAGLRYASSAEVSDALYRCRRVPVTGRCSGRGAACKMTSLRS